MQDHGSRIQLQGLVSFNARVIPTPFLGIIHKKHMIAGVFAKAQF